MTHPYWYTGSNLFIFMTILYSILWLYHNLYNHFLHGNFGCFFFFCIINYFVTNILEHDSLHTCDWFCSSVQSQWWIFSITGLPSSTLIHCQLLSKVILTPVCSMIVSISVSLLPFCNSICMKWHLLMALVCCFLITSKVGYLFIFLSGI